jgi:hypothetical protein
MTGGYAKSDNPSGSSSEPCGEPRLEELLDFITIQMLLA